MNDAVAPVAIVGAGPVGLALALGLARHGVRSTVLERRAATSAYSKAPGIHVRTREALAQWGVAHRLVEAGVLREELTLHDARSRRRPLLSVDFSELGGEVDRPGLLVLEQGETERLLLEAVRETGMCEVRFGAEVVGLEQDGQAARLAVRQAGRERSLEAPFVAGCDGASSFVRGALGLPFDGITYSLRPMLADVRVTDGRDALAWPRVLNGPGGYAFAVRIRPGLWRLVRLQRGEAPEGDDVPEAEVQRRVAELLGHGPVEVVWASRFRTHRRSSPRFRSGRVVLAGDAAHVHSPIGGQGMNAGVADAHNLAWKLAAAMRGGDADRLLDSYDAERRAVVVGNVSRFTDVATRAFLLTPRGARRAAFGLLRGLLRIPPVRRRALRRASMIDLDYPASPLLDGRARAAGRRLPNPLLRSARGEQVRLHDLLPAGPALLVVTTTGGLGADVAVEATIRVGPGAYRDPSRLLRGLIGGRDGWILVRPDLHVAWARQVEEGLDGEAVRAALGARG